MYLDYQEVKDRDLRLHVETSIPDVVKANQSFLPLQHLVPVLHVSPCVMSRITFFRISHPWGEKSARKLRVCKAKANHSFLPYYM